MQKYPSSCGGKPLFKHSIQKIVTDDSGTYELMNCDYEYPQLAEEENIYSYNKINKEIQKEIFLRYNKNCNTMESNVKELLELYQSQTELKPPSWFPLTASSRYKITYNQNDLLSIVFEEFLWFGGAHPMTEQFSLTFDLCSGNQLEAKDILGYSDEKIKQQIAIGFEKEYERNPEKFFPEEIKKLKRLDFTYQYYLTENAINFYFNPYELGPYVSGVLNYKMYLTQ